MLLVVPFAFLAFILLINTNSYFADTHHLAWLYLTVGIVSGLFACYQLSIVIKQGGGGSSTGAGAK